MRDGFVKIAAGTPKIKVADCMYNAEQIIALMKEAAGQGVKVLSLPLVKNPCPADGHSKREEIKQLLTTLTKTYSKSYGFDRG